MKTFQERLKIHYLPLLIIVAIVIVIFHHKWPNKDLIIYIADASGYISLILITFSLMIGPINLVFHRKNPISTYFRRDIGITGGLLAILHSVTGLFVHLRGKSWMYFLNKTDHEYTIRLDNFGKANYIGLISCLIIILLLMTSNDYSIRKLDRMAWKNIQRFFYLAFILAIIHCIYYRIVQTNLNLIWYLYVPLLITVILFQVAGIREKVRSHSAN
jgi:sulfoxide reductase heme-binding subunit YedZ